ncbi:MAG: hypothetical protein K8R21_05530, partial [Leptospira sp.]|nr:hypothetical protein [Leptospira sp.]
MLRLSMKSRHARLSLYYFVFWFIFSVASLIENSFFNAWSAYLNYAALLILFQLPFYIFFLYNFPENRHRLESKIVFSFFMVLSVVLYVYYIFATFGAKVYFSPFAETYYFESDGNG